METFDVEFYENKKGNQPAKEFLLGLDVKSRGGHKQMSVKFEDFLEEQLQNPDVKKEYEALQPERAIIQAIIDSRINKGLTQKELSKLTGIAQGDISKMETGNANPSIRTLQRLASAMGMKLRIEFVSDTSGAH